MIEVTLATGTVTFADEEPVTAKLRRSFPRAAVPTVGGTNYVLRWAWELKTITLSCMPKDAELLRRFKQIIDGKVEKVTIGSDEYDVVRSENLTARKWAGDDDLAKIWEVVFYVV